MNQKITVTQLNTTISQLISNHEPLAHVLVEGELSNFKRHSSGHLYFSLKDERSLVRCVMFRGQTGRVNFNPIDGNKVIIKGHVGVYEKNGSYQLYVSEMTLHGAGDLYLKFEQLKKRLALEGLFEIERKRKIPYLPSTIGIITSPTGAVIKDITNVLDRRFPNYNAILYPSKVQGVDAHKTIISGIKYFNNFRNVDVIIIARGGGSIEDLWPFNEENLAYEIASSSIPIISAIGHETDFTIADFVADLRAPTPSAAAELVLPNLDDIKIYIKEKKIRLITSMKNLLVKKKQLLAYYADRPVMKRPDEYVNKLHQRIDQLDDKLKFHMKTKINSIEKDFVVLLGKMQSLSPLDTIKRGYAVIETEEKKLITSVKDVSKDDIIIAKMSDGIIISKVLDKEKAK
ncbi:MAG: exodeoxyribonuclease VII large subunit [Clostridiales bacterium]|nr:exodeoxyribonuclease VII large subunit [Clostridiales bacterium]